MSSDELRVILRDFQPEIDNACLYSTWRNAAAFSGLKDPKNLKSFFREKNALIRDTLKSAIVKIACLEYDPLTIIGYSVATGTHLDFIYVKIEYRNKGIGRLLMPKNIQTVTPDLTKIGAAIVKKKNLKIKGEKNVSSSKDSGD